LEKESCSYGYTIRGGYNEDKQKSRPLIVTNIRAGGPADREGTLKIGDRIVAINGINIINATLQDAYFILKQCKGLTLFLVEYDSAIVGRVWGLLDFFFSKNMIKIVNNRTKIHQIPSRTQTDRF
jgi:hypothetical protein